MLHILQNCSAIRHSISWTSIIIGGIDIGTAYIEEPRSLISSFKVPKVNILELEEMNCRTWFWKTWHTSLPCLPLKFSVYIAKDYNSMLFVYITNYGKMTIFVGPKTEGNPRRYSIKGVNIHMESFAFFPPKNSALLIYSFYWVNYGHLQHTLTFYQNCE